MQFVFEQIRVGGDRNFSYLIGDRTAKEAIIIDPSYDPGKVISRCEAQGLIVSHIVITHGHHDHINGNEEAQEKTGAPILASEHAVFPHQISVPDGQSIKIGEFPVRFLHTPGHADDHMVLLLDLHHVLLSADLIFVGKVGGTRTEEDARVQWRSIQRVLSETNDSYTLWPGHDYGCRPVSSVLLEKKCNPFLVGQSEEEFIRIKDQWSDIKLSNGLL